MVAKAQPAVQQLPGQAHGWLLVLFKVRGALPPAARTWFSAVLMKDNDVREGVVPACLNQLWQHQPTPVDTLRVWHHQPHLLQARGERFLRGSSRCYCHLLMQMQLLMVSSALPAMLLLHYLLDCVTIPVDFLCPRR